MKTEKIKGFTPTPIRVADGQVNSEDKQYHRQFLNSFTKHKLVWGFTLVELLTAVAIVAMLIGLLMPALNLVRKLAKEVKQKAQIGSIEIGLNLYRNDFGEYPPSHGIGFNSGIPHDDDSYTGAQTLAEAMFGWDLLGVHPNTIYRYTGYDSGTTNLYLSSDPNNLAKRKGPYLDRTNIGVFIPTDIFPTGTAFGSLYPNRYVICDTFTAVSKKIGPKTYKIGTPVLYFRANTSAEYTQLIPSASPDGQAKNIYNYFDNYRLMKLGKITDVLKTHNLVDVDGEGSNLYKFIRDPMIPVSGTNSCGRPVHPDSYILISAGSDGIYGTKDDICNFDPNSI